MSIEDKSSQNRELLQSLPYPITEEEERIADELDADDEYVPAPPIGAFPRNLWEERNPQKTVKTLVNRSLALLNAYYRYVQVDLVPDKDWLNEAEQRIQEIKRLTSP